MPDTTEVDLIIKIDGAFNKWASFKPVTWAATLRLRFDPTSNLLSIGANDEMDGSDFELWANLDELKEAIAELEKFNQKPNR